MFRDEGISGTKGRDKRPGLDALLKGVARREFDVVAAWSVCRLGRSRQTCSACSASYGRRNSIQGRHAIYLKAAHDRLNSRKPLIQPDQRVRNL